MAQINTTLTSKLSAPHLRGLKKQELLDLYQRLHQEWGSHKEPEVDPEPEVDASGKESEQKSTMMTVREMPIMMREMQMPIPAKQNTVKRIVRDAAGRILEVIEETV